MASSQKQCKFCNRSDVKYTCPRCSEGYCSSTCYKDPKHVNCSENFYKELVMAELSGQKCSPEQKAKMLRTLQKLEAEEREGRDMYAEMDADEDEEEVAGQVDEDDYDDEDDILERFGDLEIENGDPPVEEIWKRLSEKERREFTELYESGEAAKFVPVWDPWWRQKKKLVEEIDGSSDILVSSNCPPFPILVSLADHAYSTTESPAGIAYDVINCLYAYAFTMKLYNGDYKDFLIECITQMMEVSGTLGSGHHHSSVEFSIVDAINRIHSEHDTTDYGTAPVDAVKEVLSIVEGPSIAEKTPQYCICALSDVRNLCRLAKNNSPECRGKTFHERLESAEIMLSFQMSWLNEHYGEIIKIYPEIDSFYERKTKRDKNFQAETNRMDETVKNHRTQLSNTPKIVELS